MDYFKHYSTASRSNLLNHLLEEMGPAGYAYWFLLLELCAESWDGEGLPRFRFHTRVLRQKLRISQTKLEVFLGFCQGFGSLSFHFDSKWIDLDIPKLAEVKTSRKLIKSNKNLVSVDKEIDTDKEIEKEALALIAPEVITPKKHSPKKSTSKKAIVINGFFDAEPPLEIEEVSADQLAINVLTALNTICFLDHRPNKLNMGHINARIREKYTYEDFLLVIKHKQATWANVPNMAECLRPRTLFCSNFDDYLQAAKNAFKPKVDPLDAFMAQYEHTFSAEA